MHGDVGGRPAAVDRGGGLVAEDLLDGVGDERGVGDQLGPLVGVGVEVVGHPAEVAGDGLGAGDEQHEPELGELHVGEAADRAVVLGDLGVQEVGEHVVARGGLALAANWS